MENGSTLKSFYTLKTGEEVAGVVITYCPYCGEYINSHILGELP
jgi:hypothetical protein